MRDTTDLAAAFERERPYLRTVSLRMLGSDEDAEDAVQEAWLRLNRAGGEGIDDLRAWLTTVISRVCLDTLRTRRTRREVPVEIDLDGLLATTRVGGESRTPTPEEEVLLAESVGLALHVVMDSLTPAERVAFVLHDIFDLPFGQIADVLGRSTDAVKMLASRARQRVRVVPPEPRAGDADDRAVVDAFVAAARPRRTHHQGQVAHRPGPARTLCPLMADVNVPGARGQRRGHKCPICRLKCLRGARFGEIA